MKTIDKNDNIIVIEKEVALPGTDIILEKGDRIKVLEQDKEDKD